MLLNHVGQLTPCITQSYCAELEIWMLINWHSFTLYQHTLSQCDTIMTEHILLIINAFSSQCCCWQSSHAEQRGWGRYSSEGSGWQHQHRVRPVHLLLDRGGEDSLVVRQPPGTLHGPVSQDRLWSELLWWVKIIFKHETNSFLIDNSSCSQGTESDHSCESW